MQLSPTRISFAIAVALVALAGTAAADAPKPRDGQRDFDGLLGKWNIKLKKLKKPLSGSKEWVELTGTIHCRPLWDGKANIEEGVFTAADGTRINGITLRLYSPESGQWRLYWANQKTGQLDIPVIGEFKDGVGEFFDQEIFNGRAIFVRYQWSKITPKSAHFEQSFSTDGGKTWEVNWITDQTRVE